MAASWKKIVEYRVAITGDAAAGGDEWVIRHDGEKVRIARAGEPGRAHDVPYLNAAAMLKTLGIDAPAELLADLAKTAAWHRDWLVYRLRDAQWTDARIEAALARIGWRKMTGRRQDRAVERHMKRHGLTDPPERRPGRPPGGDG